MPTADRSAWTVPAARSKNGRSHFVPLSTLASALVEEAFDRIGADVRFAFPSRAACGHVDNSMLASGDGAIARQCCPTTHPERQAGRLIRQHRMICDGRLQHDWPLRACRLRTLPPFMNYMRADVTGRVYDHYRRADEKRRALDRWARVLTGIIEQAPASNVVALR